MRVRRFSRPLAAGILAFAICLVNGGAVQAATPATATHAQHSALVVVKDYFAALDAALKTGNFANLSMTYAPNATLKVIDVYGNATEYHGLAAIIHYWQHRGKQVPGLHFTADRIVPLDVLHVAAFERTSTAAQKVLAGRCAHLFKVIGGRIVFDSYFGVAFTKAELALTHA